MKSKFFTILLTATVLLTLFSKAQETTPIKRPRITGVAHIALYVKDMENARQFYKDYLGYAEPYSLMKKDGSGLMMIFIKVNDRQVIELFPEKASGTDRLFHFAIETDDAEGMRQYLASKGCTVPKELTIGRTGDYGYFVTDPNGTICEIYQYGKESSLKKTAGKDNPPTQISKRMRHIGFAVPDLDLAMKFYRDILGFKETWRGSADEKNVNWVTLSVPDGDDYIEFLLYDKEPTLARKGTLNHICLEVDDITTASNTLKLRTLPMFCKIPSEPKLGKDMKKQINCYDGDGTRVEIMEANTVDGKEATSSNLPPLKFVKQTL